MLKGNWNPFSHRKLTRRKAFGIYLQWHSGFLFNNLRNKSFLDTVMKNNHKSNFYLIPKISLAINNYSPEWMWRVYRYWYRGKSWYKEKFCLGHSWELLIVRTITCRMIISQRNSLHGRLLTTVLPQRQNIIYTIHINVSTQINFANG